MAIPTKFKKMRVPLVDVVEDFERNVREPVEGSYDSPNMRESLKMMGQQTTVKLEHINGKYYILQGNRRIHNMKILQSEGAIDPRTNAKFEQVDAEVYDQLDDRDRLALIADQGDMRSLNKLELYITCRKAFAAGYNEKEVVVLLGDLLALHYPPNRKVKAITEDGGTDMLNYYRGVVQGLKQVFQSPEVLEKAVIEKLRGNQKWPTNAEVREFHKIHTREVDTDKTGTISRINPGPEFMAKWNEYLTRQAEAMEESGKPKPLSMMNRTTVEDLLKACDSRIFKFFINVVLRRVSQDGLAKIDQMLAKEIEPHMTEDQKALLDFVFGAKTEPTPSEEEAAAGSK